MKKLALGIISIVVFINLSFINWLTGPDDISYSTGNGSFTFDEFNTAGRNYKLCLRNFQTFKSLNSKDTVLYRITPKLYSSFGAGETI